MTTQPDQKKRLGLEGRISVENHFSRKQYAKRYCHLVRNVVDVLS